jgi:anti-sigma factor ChrR (cupin superfamily)
MQLNTLQLNTRFDLQVVLHSSDLPWVDSPSNGVLRRLLEREGAEQGRATSVVRYAAGAGFAAHTHPLGEEILVLEGEFADEHGVYSAGSYLRHPAGSRHTPYSPAGCTLFVKLRHLDAADAQAVRIDTHRRPWQPGLVPGLEVMPLAGFGSEHTALVRWAPGTQFSSHRHWGGEEIFVIDGVFEDEHGSYPAGTWMRSPHLSQHRPFSRKGCTILVKTGHLPIVDRALQA